MKTNDIQINATYQVKIGRNIVPVQITGPNPDGGLYGILVKSGKGIAIKDTRRLTPLEEPGATTPEPTAKNAKKAAEATQSTKAEKQRDTGERAATGGQRKANDAKPKAERPKLYTVEYQPEADTAEAIEVNKAPAKMTLLDAAAHLLSLGTGAPMRCKDIVDLAIARGLWSPGKGKTPANTLYAAILREIREKPTESRFIKIARGRFAHKDSDFVKHERGRLHEVYR